MVVEGAVKIHGEITKVGLPSLAEQYLFSCLMSGQKNYYFLSIHSIIPHQSLLYLAINGEMKGVVKWNRRYLNLQSQD